MNKDFKGFEEGKLVNTKEFGYENYTESEDVEYRYVGAIIADPRNITKEDIEKYKDCDVTNIWWKFADENNILKPIYTVNSLLSLIQDINGLIPLYNILYKHKSYHYFGLEDVCDIYNIAPEELIKDNEKIKEIAIYCLNFYYKIENDIKKRKKYLKRISRRK